MSESILKAYSHYLQAEKTVAEMTRRRYLDACRDCLNLLHRQPEAFFLPPDWQWPQLDKRALEMYFRQLREVRGWKPASVRQQASGIRSFLRFLRERGHIRRDPLRDYYPPGDSGAGAVPQGSEAAVQALFQRPLRSLADARLLAVLELLYGGGLRPSQVYGLRGVVLLDTDAVQLHTATDTLELPLSAGGRARLAAYLEQRFLCLPEGGEAKAPFWVDRQGREVSPARLGRAVRQAMEAVGLAGAGAALRQLGGRHFRERGADVRSLQRFLGARRLGGLQRYGAADFAQTAAHFKRLHPRRQAP